MIDVLNCGGSPSVGSGSPDSTRRTPLPRAVRPPRAARPERLVRLRLVIPAPRVQRGRCTSACARLSPRLRSEHLAAPAAREMLRWVVLARRRAPALVALARPRALAVLPRLCRAPAHPRAARPLGRPLDYELRMQEDAATRATDAQMQRMVLAAIASTALASVPTASHRCGPVDGEPSKGAAHLEGRRR